MWDEPYLESCCRSALHRLSLAGNSGRPRDEPKDLPCLERLEAMALATLRADGRYAITRAGSDRHDTAVMAATRP